jgi:hypothetical protein
MLIVETDSNCASACGDSRQPKDGRYCVFAVKSQLPGLEPRLGQKTAEIRYHLAWRWKTRKKSDRTIEIDEG